MLLVKYDHLLYSKLVTERSTSFIRSLPPGKHTNRIESNKDAYNCEPGVRLGVVSIHSIT